MSAPGSYLPKYASSRALVIGINKYNHAGPLAHACNDARAVAEVLVDKFDFPAKNVELLLDAKASRDGIIRTFLSYADSNLLVPTIES
jgi:uncharacterized caspase-like protein